MLDIETLPKSDYDQFMDKDAFAKAEANHSTMNGYFMAREVLELQCLDGGKQWAEFLTEFQARFASLLHQLTCTSTSEAPVVRLGELDEPATSPSFHAGYLQGHRARIDHLTVHTSAIGEATLPSSMAAPDFFPTLRLLFERMQESGELKAREDVFQQYAQKQTGLDNDIEDVIRRSIEGTMRKRLLEAVEKEEDGEAAFQETAALRQTMYQKETQNLSNWLSERLFEIGEQFKLHYKEQKRRSRLESKALSPIVKYKCDNIHRAAVRAVSTSPTWKPGLEGFAYATEQRYANLHIAVGLPSTPGAKDLWGYLCQAGPVMVKAHYALWARWYEEGGVPGQYITVNISQFCEDLGYTKHHKGGYRRPQKQEAVKRLEALTSIEMVATFTPAGQNKPAQRLRGPLWQRGLIGEQNDQYGDLFGAVREGEAEQWEPVAFSFAPGAWFSNPEWSQQNRYIGKISVGLLKLSADDDKWAILIGGYLATLTRTNQYKPLCLGVETILNRTELSQSYDSRRRAERSQTYFEKALDKLADVGVIQGWEFDAAETMELDDANDSEQVASYYADEASKKWRSQKVKITLPHSTDTNRLEEAQRKAIAGSKARAKRSQ